MVRNAESSLERRRAKTSVLGAFRTCAVPHLLQAPNRRAPCFFSATSPSLSFLLLHQHQSQKTPPPLPQAMATIHSLPIELLSHILDLSFDEYGSIVCYRTMRATALVSKSWTALACERLWRRVSSAGARSLAPTLGSNLRRRERRFIRIGLCGCGQCLCRSGGRVGEYLVGTGSAIRCVRSGFRRIGIGSSAG